MKNSLGLIEMRSIVKGMKTTDEMLKSADVELIMSSSICPGKYIILVLGNVGSVKSAIETGIRVADSFIIKSHIITNLDEKVITTLKAKNKIEQIKSLGAIETKSALVAVKIADIAVKASNVELIEIKYKIGIGGKGVVSLTGEYSAVKSAIDACLNEYSNTNEIIESMVIPSPHKEFINKLYKNKLL
jgi:microcompartment protein CcmL/EutN